MGIAAAVAGVALWARNDYRAWLALGAGGLPSTWRGWLQMMRWRLLKTDPVDLTPLRSGIGLPEDVSTLADLPTRRGPRPQVAPHPVPHRQLTDHAPAGMKEALHAVFDSTIQANPERLFYAKSYFEKHNEAVTLRAAYCSHPDARATHGEIGHIHPSDGSMHMVLSASDARAVIERGWGERHGLAGIALGLPLTYTLVYAPRTEDEVEIEARILKASVAYMARSGTRNDRSIIGSAI